MGVSKKDLQLEVNYLNDKYCRNTSNHLVIHQAYGGYCVGLTGKTYKKGNKIRYYKNSIGGGMVPIGNDWHDTARNTIIGLQKSDSRGWIKNTIRHIEKRKH